MRNEEENDGTGFSFGLSAAASTMWLRLGRRAKALGEESRCAGEHRTV